MTYFKLLLLWTGAIILCLTIYTFGQSTYYCYQNQDGLGFTSRGYRGESIVKMWNLYDREICSYVGTRKIFDKQPTARKSFIIMILGLSTLSACRINRKREKRKRFSPELSLLRTNHETRKPLIFTVVFLKEIFLPYVYQATFA